MDKKYRIDLYKVIWGCINKKNLLFKLTTPEISIFELNGISLKIWKMLTLNFSQNKILNTLYNRYPKHKDKISIEFRELIKNLKKENIIDEIH
ncbi:MAG: hypothetical protein PHO70_01985 [Candidatus Omnitrophica bacterium]|nr:hypothetical protein [Candidatus Omnitrophota bacterium]